MEKEIWKEINGYKGIYQISNFGRIKSVARINSRGFKVKEKIRKTSVTRDYMVVSLYKEKKQITKTVHKLVAIAFLNHIPCGYKLVVNHKDLNKLNNYADNLEIITQRENSNKKHIKSSSKYTGVAWDKKASKWRAYISINKERKYLGLFLSEIEAHNAYQEVLNNYLKTIQNE